MCYLVKRHLCATVETFIERRFSVIVGIDDHLFSTEEDDVVEIHVPDVSHAGEKDISVSGPADGKILHVAISIAICQVSLEKNISSRSIFGKRLDFLLQSPPI